MAVVTVYVTVKDLKDTSKSYIAAVPIDEDTMTYYGNNVAEVVAETTTTRALALMRNIQNG